MPASNISQIRNVMLTHMIMPKVKKTRPSPDVTEDALVKPDQERSETTVLTPEQVDSNDEIEYDQMMTAENDMDGDDNPDVNPEA
jgi:hypothetical protein